MLLLLLNAPEATAQDCDCDHRIELDVTGVNGDELGVAPGDRVCVMAGSREFLRMRHFQGSAEEPVTIVLDEAGGDVLIEFLLYMDGADGVYRTVYITVDVS